MKKLFLSFSVVVLLLQGNLVAQRNEICLFGGYTFPVRASIYQGSAYVVGSANYGLMVDIGLPLLYDFEVMYKRMDTRVTLRTTSTPYDNLPVSINYLQFGGLKAFDVGPDAVRPFVGLNLGLAAFAPKRDYYDVWFFSVGASLGSKFYVNDFLGFRVQASLDMPIQGVGADFIIGPGGSGGGLDLYTTIVQFQFNGGLLFRFGGIRGKGTPMSSRMMNPDFCKI